MVQLRDRRRVGELKLDEFTFGRDTFVVTTIAPGPAKADKDIALPTITPVLVRKKTLADEIAALDIGTFVCPPPPMKEDSATARNVFQEGDVIVIADEQWEDTWRYDPRAGQASPRSTVIGLTRPALHAGTAAAATVTASRTRPAMAITPGSCAEVANSMD